MIKHITDKLTHKVIESDVDLMPPMNLCFDKRFPAFTAVYDEYTKTDYENLEAYLANSIHDPSVAVNMPTPNLSTHYEGSPHAWLLEHAETGIRFIFFSDGRRVNHFKGSRVEIIMNGKVNDEGLAEAYRDVKNYLVSHNQYYRDALDGSESKPTTKLKK